MRQTPAERETAAEAARIQQRAQVERQAVELLQSVLPASQVDAMLRNVGLERSGVFSQRRGTRPPQLATFIAAIRFDPAFGREALAALAADLGCVVVPRDEAPSARPRLAALLEDLHEELGRLRSACSGPEEDVLAAG